MSEVTPKQLTAAMREMCEQMQATLNMYEILDKERKPGEPPFSLSDSLPDSVREVLQYVAESDCATSLSTPPHYGCECVCCEAARLLEKYWPEEASPLDRDRVVELLDVIDDARQLYLPEELTAAGFPERLVRNVTRKYGESQVAVVGLAMIEELAEESGVNRNALPTYMGWQRTMRSIKAAIRRQWKLPAVAGEGD
jgi:hypothetical protein